MALECDPEDQRPQGGAGGLVPLPGLDQGFRAVPRNPESSPCEERGQWKRTLETKGRTRSDDITRDIADPCARHTAQATPPASGIGDDRKAPHALRRTSMGTNDVRRHDAIASCALTSLASLGLRER